MTESVKQIKKPKKKKGCLAALLSILIFIGLAAICIALLLPGFYTPKDLGVKTSKEAYNSAVGKLNYVKDSAPVTGSANDYVYTYGELMKVSASLTSEELTSFFNYDRPDYYALKKVQIRLNPDNTVEFSAALDTGYFMNTVLGGKYSEQEINKAFNLSKVLPGTVNVYAQLSGEIANNKSANVTFSDIEVMGIDLPYSLYATPSAQEEISSIVDNFLAKTTEKTKGKFESVKIQNGQLAVIGSLPSTLKREKAR